MYYGEPPRNPNELIEVDHWRILAGNDHIRFMYWYIDQNETNPTEFPSKRTEAEWDEAFSKWKKERTVNYA